MEIHIAKPKLRIISDIMLQLLRSYLLQQMTNMEGKLLNKEMSLVKLYQSLIGLISLSGQYFTSKSHDKFYLLIYHLMDITMKEIGISLQDESADTSRELQRIHTTISVNIRR